MYFKSSKAGLKNFLATALVLTLIGGLGTSALLETFGKFETSAEVERSIFVDGGTGTVGFTYLDTHVGAGESLAQTHFIENTAESPANLSVKSYCLKNSDIDPVSGTTSKKIVWTKDSGENSGACNGIITRFIDYFEGAGSKGDINTYSSSNCSQVLTSPNKLIGETGRICISSNITDDLLINSTDSEIIFLKDSNIGGKIRIVGSNLSVKGLNISSDIEVLGTGINVSETVVENGELTVKNSSNIRLTNMKISNFKEKGIEIVNSSETRLEDITVEKGSEGIVFNGGNRNTVTSAVVRLCGKGIVLDSSVENVSLTNSHSNNNDIVKNGFTGQIQNSNKTKTDFKILPGEKDYFGVVNSFALDIEPGNYVLKSELIPGD